MIMAEILTTHITRYSSFFEMVSLVEYLSNKPITKENIKGKIIIKSTHLVLDFFYCVNALQLLLTRQVSVKV